MALIMSCFGIKSYLKDFKVTLKCLGKKRPQEAWWSAPEVRDGKGYGKITQALLIKARMHKSMWHAHTITPYTLWPDARLCMCTSCRLLRGESLLIFWSNPRLPLNFKALAIRSFSTSKHRVLLQLWAGDRVHSVLDSWLTLEPVLFSTARQILFLWARPCNGSPFTHCPLQSSLPARNISFRSKERWPLRMSVCEKKTQNVCVRVRIWICREKVSISISLQELPLLGLTQLTASSFFFFICGRDKLFLI